MLIKFNGELMSVHRMEHRTPGNLRGFVRAWLRNMRTGSMFENRFSSEDQIERVTMDTQDMEYLYEDGDHFHFMNSETYEQTAISREQLGDQVNYLMPNTKVVVQFYEGSPFSVDLPQTMDLKVVETEPAIKGATVTNVNKPAKLETGLVVQVPPFIKEGEIIRVNTDDGSYVSRA
jgi:elongation factor P